jgi:hypothetical protein
MSTDTGVAEPTSTGSRLSTRVLWSRRGYVLFAGLFVVCVLIQVYIAGMAVFVNPEQWSLHTAFIHVFEFLPIIMLVLAFAGQLPRRLKWLPVGLVLLIGIQYATAEGFSDSLVAAIHPVNALAIFWVGMITTRKAWQTLSSQMDDD